MIREFENFFVADSLEDAVNILSNRAHSKYLWVLSGGISFKVNNIDEATEFFKNPMGYNKDKQIVKKLAKEMAQPKVRAPQPPPILKPQPTIVIDPTPKRFVGSSDSICPQCNGQRIFIDDNVKDAWAKEIKAYGRRKTSDICAVCKGKGRVKTDHYE